MERFYFVKCYLIRYDTTEKQCFLTVLIKKKDTVNTVSNFAIETEYNSHSNRIIHRLKGLEVKHPNIQCLLSFYENEPINFEVGCIGAGIWREDHYLVRRVRLIII